LLIALWTVSPMPAIASVDCGECHEDQPDPTRFADSVHGFLECVDCHTAAEDIPHPEEIARVDCATCHDDVVEAYSSSIHGVSRENGSEEAPACAACHGDVHELIPGTFEDSPVHRSRLPETCGSCHSDPEVVQKFGIPVARPIEAYHDSVHGKLCDEGIGSASCSDCHQSHSIFPSADPRSTVNHQRVPETCGQCHAEIAEVYESSVHGKALRHGVREAPVCTDCHGEHRIISPNEKGSPVFATNIPKMTCGRCHADLRMAEKFGIQADTVTAYEDSYHGLASRSGMITVAHCASCHGVHDILPSSDPSSHIHADNLAATCGSCHPGAGETFAIGPVHIDPTEREHAAVFFIRWTYLVLIYVTIGGMVLHNALDLYRKNHKPPSRAAPPGPTEQRMSAGFRIAHAWLIISFLVLLHSGFALKYPESWWARPFLQWEAQLGLRGIVHRTAAVMMLLALGFHVLHLAVDRRARACIARMRPAWEDLHELKGRVAWFFGRRPEAPAAPKLGYAEKMEYLALVWGLVVMTVTGFLLWFDDLLLRFLPKWVSDVATVIHFYEAVLASLAILVWHLYFVIFDPVVYPMDPAWLTGHSAPGRALERAEGAVGRPTPGRRPKRKGTPKPRPAHAAGAADP
jgi:cytochrome b subunit of formate dehydrogenase